MPKKPLDQTEITTYTPMGDGPSRVPLYMSILIEAYGYFDRQDKWPSLYGQCGESLGMTKTAVRNALQSPPHGESRLKELEQRVERARRAMAASVVKAKRGCEVVIDHFYANLESPDSDLSVTEKVKMYQTFQQHAALFDEQEKGETLTPVEDFGKSQLRINSRKRDEQRRVERNQPVE